jgi:hypothetical protein
MAIVAALVIGLLVGAVAGIAGFYWLLERLSSQKTRDDDYARLAVRAEGLEAAYRIASTGHAAEHEVLSQLLERGQQ